jgi:hypothetical protein
MLVIAFPVMAKEVAMVAIKHLNFMRAKGNRACCQKKSTYCHTCPGSRGAIGQVCIDNEMKVAHLDSMIAFTGGVDRASGLPNTRVWEINRLPRARGLHSEQEERRKLGPRGLHLVAPGHPRTSRSLVLEPSIVVPTKELKMSQR